MSIIKVSVNRATGSARQTIATHIRVRKGIQSAMSNLQCFNSRFIFVRGSFEDDWEVITSAEIIVG